MMGKVPALLEAGEFVVKKERARIFAGLLTMMNSGPISRVQQALTQIPRFQNGSIVQNLHIPQIPQLAIRTRVSANIRFSVGRSGSEGKRFKLWENTIFPGFNSTFPGTCRTKRGYFKTGDNRWITIPWCHSNLSID